MSDAPKLELVVAAGPDLGARAKLGSEPIVVGRDRAAGLQLTDLGVSRRHLEVTAQGGKVLARTLGSAAPFTVGGRQLVEARLAVGERIVVGNTALALVEERPGVEVTETREVTDVRSLLGDLGAGARGLGAIFELGEKLDAAADEQALVATVEAWASRHVRSGARIELVASAEPEVEQGQLVVRGDDAGVRVAVPLIGVHGAALDLRAPMAAAKVGVEQRRLLAVTGKLVASSLMRIRSVGRAEAQATEMRRLAVGSARSFLGQTPGAERVSMLLERLARSDAVALLIGETGSGKSFLARLVHEASARAAEPFRVINCAAIPDNLVEAELFGHEKGAFTGAAGERQGAIEAAGAGTLLLDEIGDLPLASQAKLLRVLEEKQYERLGSNETLKVRARVLAATNRDLKQMVEEGSFRSDLYYRISVVTVPVPSLAERQGDIPLLAQRFLDDLAPAAGRRVTGFSPNAIEALKRYRWPGNVRELRNVIEHALVLGDGPIIEPSDLPPDVAGAPPPQPDDADVVRLPLDLATLEARAIEAALRASGGNRTKAASLLGINRVTLYKKLRSDE